MSIPAQYIRNEADRQRAIRVLSIAVIPEHGLKMALTENNEKRRDVQNRLMWVWNNAIQAHMRECTGQIASAEDWHEILVKKLMPAEPRILTLPGGDVYESGRTRTSQLGVRAMAEYLTLLDSYCGAELGLNLPRGDDDYHMAMMGRMRAAS